MHRNPKTGLEGFRFSSEVRSRKCVERLRVGPLTFSVSPETGILQVYKIGDRLQDTASLHECARQGFNAPIRRQDFKCADSVHVCVCARMFFPTSLHILNITRSRAHPLILLSLTHTTQNAHIIVIHSPHLCVGFLLLKSLPSPPPPPPSPPTLFAHSSHSSLTHQSLTYRSPISLTDHSLISLITHSLINHHALINSHSSITHLSLTHLTHHLHITATKRI